MTNNECPVQLPDLKSPRKLVEGLGGAISLGLLRSQLLRRNSNGLAASGAVIKISSRKILIDRIKYWQWLQERATLLEVNHGN